MFDVFTNLTCVSQVAGRSAWLWSVEFRPVEGTHNLLTHVSEGIAPTLDAAQAEMLATAEEGKRRLLALGFKIKDTKP